MRQSDRLNARWLVADVDADHHLDTHCAYNFLSADGPVVAMPMRGGRMRFLAQVHTPATAGDAEPTLEELQEIIDRRVGSIRLLRSHWLSYFQIHSAQVPRYRFGRVFLAGDAGHIHSPAGGQGMNTGMQDAFNLAWKLAAVIHGEAGDTLLDSYNAERLGLRNGGCVVVRPDGYIGAITTLDDTTAIRDYFARIAN